MDQIAPLAIFSGGFSQDEYEAERDEAESRWAEHFSWFPSLGSVSTASVLLNLVTAATMIQTGRAEAVDCLDRDLYDCESWVQLRRCPR